MKKGFVFCMLLGFWLSVDASTVWAVDVGWMQKGVRAWYFGAVGSTSASDAEEAYLFGAVNGTDVQVTKHSGLNHWVTTNAPDTGTYSLLGKGPCWMHPQVLQTLQSGDTWKGQVIATVLRESHSYDSFKAQFSFPYLLLPIKALFDLKAQRDLVKIVYYIEGYSTGIAYFDADTGLLLLYETSNGLVTVFFLLSEINYDFATQTAFAEDNGPHTGFKSFFLEQQLMPFPDTRGGYVLIQSSVESRHGTTVQMWVSTSEMGTGSYTPPFENYCFFGSVPVLRRINMTDASNYPPDQWNEYGQHLWWWVPKGVLQTSTINVFGVSMTGTSTDPYTFTATQQSTGFYFPKLWFDSDGYVTAFSAKDSTTGLDIDPERAAFYFNKSITVDGLAYYKNTMGTATPAATERDFNGDGKPDILWRNISTGENYVWYLNGVAVLGGGSLPPVGDQNWKAVWIKDFNNDGKPDVLWRNTSTGENYVWYLNGVAVLGGGILPTVTDQNWKVVGSVDFNNDGKPDVLWRNTSTGENYVWYLNGVAVLGGGSLPPVGDQNWKVVGAVDFNNDAKPDVLWRNTSTGENYVWYLNGVAVLGGGSLPPVGDQSWKVVGAGDFNNDGKPDVLWRNTSTGENYVWYLNGVAVLGGGILPAVTDQNWTIVP